MSMGMVKQNARGTPDPAPTSFLLVFYFLWSASYFLPIAAVVYWYMTASAVPLIVWLAYIVVRFLLIPPRPWYAVHIWLARYLSDRTYFQRQGMVWAEQDERLVNEKGGPWSWDLVKVKNGSAPGPAPFDPNSGQLMCYHPHGILCCGWTLNGNLNPELVQSRFHFLGADALHYAPFLRDLLAWSNCGPISKQNFKRLAGQRANMAILPGGFEEATLYERNKHRAFIKERRGFIKYALEYGMTVRIAYTFGEERTYWAFTKLKDMRLALNRLGVPGVIFTGLVGLLPDWRSSVVTVVSPPLQFPVIPNPARDDVQKWHDIYVRALLHHFETHKGRFSADGKKAKLELL